jgi:ubiquinol-cytochrome c reductase cytochrome b subunit
MFTNNFDYIASVFKNHIFKYPTPANFSYFWNFGFLSAFFLIIQLLTGIFLAMHYCSDVTLAFSSIEHIMRNVPYGWFIRYLHSNGASFFFIVVYLHIFRGLYFRSYIFYNFKIWWSGLLIFFLMMATAFIGYVLTWGQMSFWGATVIINLVSAIPVIGPEIVYWLWGGFSVSGPTLSRFFSLHYLLPFILIFLVLIHLFFLHDKGSTNPSFISNKINRGYINLYSYFFLKDFIGLFFFLFIYLFFVFYYPEALGHSDNCIESNPLSTPEHIVPEWYFLPFYAILRSIPDKLLGVCFMLGSILIFFFLPVFDFFFNKFSKHYLNSTFNTYIIHPFIIWFFIINFFILGWLGAKPVEYPFINLGIISVSIYFFLFLFIAFSSLIF